MPPSEGQEPRALTVAAQAIEGRKCAETAKVHPDLRIVYNLAYGILAGEAGRFSLVGDYTTKNNWQFVLGAGCNRFNAGIAQLVERNLAKVEVESSRLFSRSIFVHMAHVAQW